MSSRKQTPLKLLPALLLLLLLLLLAVTPAAAAQVWGLDGEDELSGDSDFVSDGEASAVDNGYESGGSYQSEDGYGYGDDSYGYGDDSYGYGDDGYGYGDDSYGYGDDGYGYGDDGYGYGDDGYGYGDDSYGYGDDSYGYEGDGYGYGDDSYGYEDDGYGYDETEYTDEISDYSYEESGYGYEDDGYGYDGDGYGYDGDSYGYEGDSYGYEGDSYGYEGDSYGYEGDSYGYEGDSYGYEGGDDFGMEDGASDYDNYEKSRSGRYRGGRYRGRGRPVQIRSGQSGLDPDTDAGSPEIEFEDGSATADQIPEGYFSQAESSATPTRYRQQGGGASVTGGIDLPGFRIIIGTALQWWKYDKNVCLSKENLPPREFEGSDPHMSMYSVRCGQNSATEYSCIVSQWNGTAATSQRLTYSCCTGFTRLRGDRGCPRNAVSSSTDSRTFADLLRTRGYSSRAIEMFNSMMGNDTKKQWTVFLPGKDKLEKEISRMEELSPTSIRDAGRLLRSVRTMLNHLVEPAFSTSALRSRQSVATRADSNSLLVTRIGQDGVLINCQPLVQANLVFNRYSLVHFTTGVLTVNRFNMYQLMLQRLENFTATDTAKRLLAPLKSTLSGIRPLTVFMHLPAADEMDNRCYARNLRAAIVTGAGCSSSLSSVGALRTIDGKLLRVQLQRGSDGAGSAHLIDGNRLVTVADQLASNGVLHLVRATESLTGFGNEATRRLKSSPEFRPLFSRPNRTEGDLALLLPPINGSHSYENTSARWSNSTELSSFGRSHLLVNATRLRGSGCRLAMLDGVARDFVQLIQRSSSGASIFSTGRLVRRRFVDCVPVTQSAKDCGGTVYFLLSRELPNFNSSLTAMDYLGRSNDTYSMTKTILSFGIRNNISGLAEALRRSDASILLVNDFDMVKLSGRLLQRRRRPTREQMTQLVQWFVRYLVAPRRACAVKQVSPSLRLPVFRLDLRPCRSVVCTLRRQMTRQMKLVLLRPGGHVTIREGFLLPGRVSR